MYVVWRKRPVKGLGGGRFLDKDFWWLEKHRDWLDDESWHQFEWAKEFVNPRCEHRGAGRIAYTPFVVQSVRQSSEGWVWDHGQPRQETLHRFPTIRTCCIADPYNRAAWWFEVERDIEGWTRYTGTTTLHTRWLLDRAAIMAKLREVVPKADPAILKGIHARTGKLQGHKAEELMARSARRRAEAEAQRRAHAEQERRQAEEQQHRQAEEERARAERGRQQWWDPQPDDDEWDERIKETMRRHHANRSGGDHAILGVAPGAPMSEVKAAYRRMVLKHHPDRNPGDPAAVERFRKIQEAWERIEKADQRRAG